MARKQSIKRLKKHKYMEINGKIFKWERKCTIALLAKDQITKIHFRLFNIIELQCHLATIMLIF